VAGENAAFLPKLLATLKNTEMLLEQTDKAAEAATLAQEWEQANTEFEALKKKYSQQAAGGQ
jgi:hypothetical protein